MNTALEILRSSIPFVKICGLTDEEMVDVAIGSGAHAIGFVFVETSPRYIELHEANQLMLQLPDEVIGVAVLQNPESLEQFNSWKGWLQLCGEEDEQMVSRAPCPVIKAVQWDPVQILRWDGVKNVVAILVDGSTGGQGKTFDITELAKMIPTLETPIIIAGGLTPENVQCALATANPAGVDVSSGVESTKGTKDPERICEFIEQVHESS